MLVFASTATILAVSAATSTHTGVPVIGKPGHTSTPSSIRIFSYYIPLAAAGWTGVGFVAFQGRLSGVRTSRLKSVFANKGFGSDVFDLMMGMRGAGSRVSLLQNMESPKHRLELSALTGIDWKEVDRQLSVLEKYGLVKVSAQSGTMKFYQMTEQGRVVLNLVRELVGSDFRN